MRQGWDGDPHAGGSLLPAAEGADLASPSPLRAPGACSRGGRDKRPRPDAHREVVRVSAATIMTASPNNRWSRRAAVPVPGVRRSPLLDSATPRRLPVRAGSARPGEATRVRRSHCHGSPVAPRPLAASRRRGRGSFLPGENLRPRSRARAMHDLELCARKGALPVFKWFRDVAFGEQGRRRGLSRRSCEDDSEGGEGT